MMSITPWWTWRWNRNLNGWKNERWNNITWRKNYISKWSLKNLEIQRTKWMKFDDVDDVLSVIDRFPAVPLPTTTETDKKKSIFQFQMPGGPQGSARVRYPSIGGWSWISFIIFNTFISDLSSYEYWSWSSISTWWRWWSMEQQRNRGRSILTP